MWAASPIATILIDGLTMIRNLSPAASHQMRARGDRRLRVARRVVVNGSTATAGEAAAERVLDAEVVERCRDEQGDAVLVEVSHGRR